MSADVTERDFEGIFPAYVAVLKANFISDNDRCRKESGKELCELACEVKEAAGTYTKWDKEYAEPL